MQGIGKRIAYDGKILMAVAAYQFAGIGLSVQPKAVFPFHLDAANSYPPLIAVDDFPFLVFYAYLQIIERRRFRRPQRGIFYR